MHFKLWLFFCMTLILNSNAQIKKSLFDEYYNYSVSITNPNNNLIKSIKTYGKIDCMRYCLSDQTCSIASVIKQSASSFICEIYNKSYIQGDISPSAEVTIYLKKGS